MQALYTHALSPIVMFRVIYRVGINNRRPERVFCFPHDKHFPSAILIKTVP